MSPFVSQLQAISVPEYVISPALYQPLVVLVELH